MKKMLRLHLVIVLSALLVVSCTSDDPKPSYPSLKGDFIVCEGAFQTNTGAIGFYNDDVADNDIFKSVNDRALGDIVQSFEVVDTLGFIVVNNSQKIEMVRMRDFVSVGKIDDDRITYPRYVAQASESTVYITNGSNAGDVIVYDFKNFEITGTITVGNGPEMMARVGDKMYVANSGGYGVDNTISIIDITKGEVIKTLTLDEACVALKKDKNNNVWVYSKGSHGGIYVYSDVKLYKIDTDADAIDKTFELDGTLGTYGSNLFALAPNGDLYYLLDGVYKMNINDTELPTEKWLETAYYGIEVNPKTGEVYCFDSATNEVIIVNSDDTSEVKKYSGTAANPRSAYYNY